MHFVSLIASERKRGNSDCLGRLALQEALENGADSGELLYLRDFRIKQCQGCLNCLFKGMECKLKDDLYRLLERLNAADLLFLVAPTYVLSIPGSLKLLLDRYLVIYEQFNSRWGRPAISVGIAALPNWSQFQAPLMNLFLLALGFRVVDSYVAYGAGQGEILLADNLPRILSAVRGMCGHPAFPPVKFESQVSSFCPVDHSTLFERIEGNHYRCPVCLTPCEQRPDGFYFRGEDLNNHRWTPARIKDHFDNWILKTGPRFRGRVGEIYRKKKELGLR